MMVLNSIVVVVTMMLNIIFGVLEIRLFLVRYGSEVNGLIQTGNQILGYLSIIEAGIGAAYLYKMYKPLAQNNYKELSACYNGFRISMEKVVLKMMIVAVIISLIYPIVLKNSGINYMYMVLIFVLLSAKFIMPYLLTMVPKYMIIIREQKYKADLISNLCKILTYIAEITLMLLFKNIDLMILLFICVIISIFTGVIFKIEMKKLYGGSLDKEETPDFSANEFSKDVLIHNISRLVFNGTDSIVISAMSSLNNVTIYSNYNLIISQVTNLLSSIIDGAAASMGIKLAKNDENAYSLFREMFTGTCCIAGIIFDVFLIVVNDFIGIAFGERFCISMPNVVMFGIVLYTGIIFPCVNIFRNARGLYKESRNFTVMQAILNLVITIVLTPFMGITGALIGTVLARMFITIPFNYKLVYNKIFPEETPRWSEFWINIVVEIFSLAVIYVILFFLRVDTAIESRIIIFTVKTVIALIVSTMVNIVAFWLMYGEFRKFIHRILCIVVSMKHRILEGGI